MKQLITLAVLLTLMLTLAGAAAGSTTLNYFDNTTQIATPYNGVTQSNFTIDWQNVSAPMGTAKLQLNWTDSKANYTMDIQSQNATNTVFYYHMIGLPAGTIQVKFFGSDSSGFQNATTPATIVVAKGNLTGKASVSVHDVIYPAYLRASGTASSILGDYDLAYNLYCNGVHVGTATGAMPTGSIKLNPGTYSCLMNTSGGDNWNSSPAIATGSASVNNNLMLYGTIGTIIGAGVILLLLKTFVAEQMTPKTFIEAIVAVAIIVLIVIAVLTTFL